MSNSFPIPMSIKNNESSFFGNALIGACCAIAASVPVSAYVASFIGDSYEVRVMVYGAILLWVISGAITIFFKTYKSEKKKNRSCMHTHSLLYFCLKF